MIVSEKNIEASALSPKHGWKLISSKSFDPCTEFIYFTEELIKTPDEKYVLHTMWLINALWAEDAIKSGLMSPKVLEPYEDYEVITEEEALVWLEIMQ